MIDAIDTTDEAALEEQLAAIQRRRDELREARRQRIRQVRLDAYNAASDALRAAEAKRDAMQADLDNGPDNQRVQELHSAAFQLQRQLETLPDFRRPAKRYALTNPWDPWHPDDQARYNTALEKWEKHARDLLAETREAYETYAGAATALYTKKEAFKAHPIHAEIGELRRRCNEAAAALDAPIN